MNRNNKNSSNSKLPEIGAVVLVLVAVGYYFYSSGSNSVVLNFVYRFSGTNKRRGECPEPAQPDSFPENRHESFPVAHLPVADRFHRNHSRLKA